MSKDINKQEFGDSTSLKLKIFKDCFEEWLPVFIHNPRINGILILDFFAGSGTDAEGQYGSPLVLLDAARGKDRACCLNASKKDIRFLFNDKKRDKSNELERNVKNHIENCEQENQCDGCSYRVFFEQKEFREIFAEPKAQAIFENKDYAKFILLDQYGFKEVDNRVFEKLISYEKTDFIFFISSSSIKRFKEHPYTTKYIDTHRIPYDETKPMECHRAIAGYFKSLIPADKEYFLHHFSLKKEKGNVYGLIFGSQHSLGMEKFMKVCWKHDPMSGESNFNIDNDWEPNTLFHNSEQSNKKTRIRQQIKELILARKIASNKEGLKFALHKGCEPKLFTEVVKELEKENRIVRTGELNFSSTKIHSVKEYRIKVLAK